jgi:hypothetical protein
MATPRFTEDIEFRTDLDTAGTQVVRRGQFVQRPRRVNGRDVPGNARYYRRRQQELLAGRGAARNATAGAQRSAQVARRTGRANPSPQAPAADGRRRGRGGVRGALARVARGIENRQRRRRLGR